MKVYNVNFDKIGFVSNIISKRVWPEKAEEELLAIINFGGIMYKENLKKNLHTHTVSKKITNVKFQDHAIVLKENCRFVFLLVSRKRLELNIEKYISKYQFSVVPRSLFRTDDKLSLE